MHDRAAHVDEHETARLMEATDIQAVSMASGKRGNPLPVG